MTRRSKSGWLSCLLGVVLVVLGVYTLAKPQLALSGLVAVYSLLAIVTGIADIVFYVRLKSSTGLGPAVSLVSGIISVLAGFMLLLNPILGRWIFSAVFPVWVIAHSISRLANYRFLRLAAGRAAANVSLVLNILCIILGVLMFIFPGTSALSLGYLVAFSLVLHGVGRVVEAFSNMGAEKPAGREDPGWQ